MEYASLFKYIPLFSDQVEQGTWIVDTKNDGSPEHPIQMPYVCYAEHVEAFITWNPLWIGRIAIHLREAV